MNIIVTENYDSMSKQAALIVASQIRVKPETVLGLATGSTPLGMYKQLAEMCSKDNLDFSKVVSFNLDEYYDLDPDNSQSYYYYMVNNLFKNINIKPENYHLPNGKADDVEKECQEYEEKINQAGGIDLQVLGVGDNGHIGFNEPGDKLSASTHLVDLTEETIEANSRFFQDKSEVPKQALTMGMSAILKAKKIILLASGKNKAEAIKNTVNNYITTNVPSSLLQTHPDITLILDKEAASLLSTTTPESKVRFRGGL